jgi:ABC-2 type transport system permease protein
MLILLWELVRKDLRQFTADRRALLISFAVPIAIASFMGTLFGSTNTSGSTAKIPLLVVDQDNSKISQAAVKKLTESPTLSVTLSSLTEAQEAIRSGKSGLAIVYPTGFGEQAQAAFTGGPPPVVQNLIDPSHSIEAQAIRGVVMQSTIRALTGSEAKPPFEISMVKETANNSDTWSGVAHAFSGMAVQGLLFWAIESAMVILRERKMGIWNRLRASPVPASTLIIGRLLSATLRATMILTAVLGFGMLFFGIRVHGSWPGLVLLGLSAAFMASSFGLFVAALGKTEAQSRGLTILAVLSMTMLGGAWFPTFLMPKWVQTISLAIPVRWAVDGLDGMTWRGNGFGAASLDAAYLVGFAVIFTAIALRRFRFEAES